MSVGVCYFPEHWPREEWDEQLAAMADAGLERVRMGEFAWARIESERGDFEFDWLHEAVDLAGDHGLSVVLCTPTATPPKWLSDERPSILAADSDGTVREHGSRRHTCFSSPAYREEAERVVTRLADEFVDDPHVEGWQIDNEYGCHDTALCYCDDCAAGFRKWLRDRYGEAETLNEAWGTTFWSQRYGSIDEVEPPGPTPAEHHPSRLLDYHRFARSAIVDFDCVQVNVLRDRNPDWTLTHNFMGDFETVDAYAVSEDHDLVSWDSYPTGFAQDRKEESATVDELRAGDPDQVGLNHDLYRSALDRPFWVMEQQPGDVNWPPYAPQPADGAMRLWAHHAVGHGADAVLYFRWRRCRQGQEQYHAGLRERDGSPDRGFYDAATVAEELEEFGGTDALEPVDADVAILHEYDNWWAITAQPHAPDFDYWEHLRTYYAALRARGVDVDVVQPTADLGRYDAVVAPTLHLVDEDLATNVDAYVRDGGHLLATIRTGVKTRANQLHDALAPGPLTETVGATVEHHESLPEAIPTTVDYRGETYDYRTWGDWLDPDRARAVGTHRTGEAAGRPAITVADRGTGAVTYCGVWPGEDLADALVVDVLDAAGVEYTDRLPDGVRVTRRGDLTWVCNFGSDPVAVDPPTGAEWVVTPVADTGAGDGEATGAGGFDAGVVDAPPTDLRITRR